MAKLLDLDCLAGRELEKRCLFVRDLVRKKFQKFLRETASRDPKAEHQPGISLGVASESSGNPFESSAVQFSRLEGEGIFFVQVNFSAKLIFQFL